MTGLHFPIPLALHTPDEYPAPPAPLAPPVDSEQSAPPAPQATKTEQIITCDRRYGKTHPYGAHTLHTVKFVSYPSGDMSKISETTESCENPMMTQLIELGASDSKSK